MEGFEKGFSPSKSTASPRRSITGLGENNENDSNQEQVNSNSKVHSHKKVVVKHFMSPTISASSKAAAPRKKILADRNENSSISDDENIKISKVDTKRDRKNSGISHSDRSSSRVVSSYSLPHESDDEGESKFLDDSSVKPYDPLTNYLSPRPKYLRFNPNKQREILSRIEREEIELDSSSDSREDDDEKESLMEELKEIIKQEYDENIKDDCDDDEEERGWCLKGVLKVILTLIACLLSTSYICSMNSPTPSATHQAISNLKDGYFLLKKQTFEVITTKVHESGFFKMERGDIYDEVEEIEEDGNGETEENAEVEMIEDYNEDLNENKDADDAVYKGPSFEELLVEKTDERDGFCLEKEIEASHDDLNVDIIDKIESEIVGAGEIEYETDEKADENEEVIVSHENLADSGLEVQEIGNDINGETEKMADESEEIIESHEKVTDPGHEDQELGNDINGEIKKIEWNNNTSAGIGVFIVSIILASLAIIYRSKKTRSTFLKETQPVLKPHKFSIEKKIEFSARPEDRPEKKIEFSTKPEEFNRGLGAPTVELIGEIVVGQMSSLRIGDKKNQMNNIQDRNDTKQAQSDSTPIKISKLEYSTTISPSYGSFTTTEKKILKKEGGRNGEPGIEVTPVRRSTRIRNRAAVMSP